jgi:cell division protein ZapE
VVVATSNVEPKELYKNGLNRQLFLPFIDLLLNRVQVLNLASQTDYRRQKLEAQPVYFFGPADETDPQLEAAWHNITGGVEAAPMHLDLMGRDFVVEHHFMGAARFDFKALCEAPLGARDYLRLSHQFHTLVVAHIPRFDRARSDAAKRLILLIDTLYDRGVKLVASFEAPLDQLSSDDKTAFEFQRTLSRLTEMQSKDYLSAPLKDAAE